MAIEGLELLSPSEIDRAVELFYRDGFVIVADVLTAEQTAFLASGVTEVVGEILAVDDGLGGNRGNRRYSFGGSSLTRSMILGAS